MSQRFAHCQLGTGKIFAINAKAEAQDGFVAVPINDPELAIKLAIGTEPPASWYAAKVEGGYELVKLVPKAPAARVRTELLALAELEILPAVDDPLKVVYDSRLAALVVVDRVGGVLEVFYNSTHLKALGHPVKIYATREGDPSYLKCVISLDVNILDAVKQQNNLRNWPNPLRIQLADGTADLSLFTHAVVNARAAEKTNA